DRPVVLMVRHAERHAIAPGSVGVNVGLTEEGRDEALRLGAELGARLRSVTTSPIVRCRATAALLCEGAECRLQLVDDSLLGGPGAFVADGDVAWANWQHLGNEGVIAHLMSSDEVLPGMHPPAVASERLLGLLLAALEREIGLHVFVTHDAILAPFIARLIGRPLMREEWPGFLDGLLLWLGERFGEAAMVESSRSASVCLRVLGAPYILR
ncbi:MAG: histidine phosphatase family protein, partial [Myxococcales bacterium]|nr:histidine phosphatase family protein [Myxococcales bacterium]